MTLAQAATQPETFPVEFDRRHVERDDTDDQWPLWARCERPTCQLCYPEDSE